MLVHAAAVHAGAQNRAHDELAFVDESSMGASAAREFSFSFAEATSMNVFAGLLGAFFGRLRTCVLSSSYSAQSCCARACTRTGVCHMRCHLQLFSACISININSCPSSAYFVANRLPPPLPPIRFCRPANVVGPLQQASRLVLAVHTRPLLCTSDWPGRTMIASEADGT